MSNDFDLPDIEDLSSGQSGIAVEEDTKLLAVKFGIIGAGQAGSRMVDTFYSLGYRRVCAINTTAQDFLGLELPVNRQLVLTTKGGAGKDQGQGQEAVEKGSESVFNLMRASFGDDIDRIMITSSLGGGTGSGGILPLIKKAVRYMEEIGKEPKIGLIVALPKKSEGGKAQSNAYLAMQKIKVLLETKEISPCVIVDNDVIQNMLGAVSAKSFWQVANKQILGLFDVFNILAAQKSSYVTFDRADYTTMLESGLITFGSTKLLSYEKDTDLSDGLRLNLERTMLTEVDLTKSTHLAAILCAPEKILSLLPQSHIDLAFSTLERILQGENRSFTIHQGVYESSRNGIYCYTMAGGFPIPEKRLAIMKMRGGLA